MKIGVFDSGHGGITILSAIKKLLPEEEYRYIADSKNCPYGEKSDEDLYHIVTQNVEELLSWGAKIIVIACNTATVRCIAKLRKDYPGTKFVGTEPAIKLATAFPHVKNILVLATPGTIESERVLCLKQSYQKPGQTIRLLACPGLADAIERNDSDIDDLLSKLIPDDHTEYDVVVLGCTHYPLIKEIIAKKFPSATLVDGSDGVAKQVARLATADKK